MVNKPKGYQEEPYDVRKVWIPVYGVGRKLVYLKWFCPACGTKRGKSGSYVGSYRVIYDIAPDVDVLVENWINPCGHKEDDTLLYDESIINGMNMDESEDDADRRETVDYMRYGF